MTDETRAETCPRCGAAEIARWDDDSAITFECGTQVRHGRVHDTGDCIDRQAETPEQRIAALQARVAELERERNDAVAEQILAESERDAAESRAEVLAGALQRAISDVTIIAADLLDGGWSSDIAEDWPARVSANTISARVGEDQERRRKMSNCLSDRVIDRLRAALATPPQPAAMEGDDNDRFAELQADTLAACRAYFDAYAKRFGKVGFLWLHNEYNGQLMAYTRGEYADEIKAFLVGIDPRAAVNRTPGGAQSPDAERARLTQAVVDTSLRALTDPSVQAEGDRLRAVRDLAALDGGGERG